MPLTFPTSPTNGQTTTLSGTTYTYNATKGVWEATASGGGFVAGSFSENILPAADATYDIGSASYKIRDLYVSDNSLHIGDHTMSADSEGINLPALKIGTGANRVKLTANAQGKLRQVRTVGGVAQAEEGLSSDAGTTAVDTFEELKAATVVAGKTVLVRNTNKLYINTGTGWYVVGQVTNESPTAITGLDATYSLATDGTATVITMNSTDPEGFPLTWSHAVTTGTLGSTATITNSDNVFTITPSSTEADAGSFSVTFSASDGNQAATSVSAITLAWAADPNSVFFAPDWERGGSNTDGYDNASQIDYEQATWSWTVPANVTSIHVLCIGAGGAGGTAGSWAAGGGGGGGLAWKNNISVTPGETLTVKAGHPTINKTGTSAGASGGASEVLRSTTVLVKASGGTGGNRGPGAEPNGFPGGQKIVGDGGGSGGYGRLGNSSNSGGGGGGAGGYTGNGGDGYQGWPSVTNAQNGSGGGGGGGGEGSAAVLTRSNLGGGTWPFGNNPAVSGNAASTNGDNRAQYNGGTSGSFFDTRDGTTKPSYPNSFTMYGWGVPGNSFKNYSGSYNSSTTYMSWIIGSGGIRGGWYIPVAFGGGGGGLADDYNGAPGGFGGMGCVRILWGTGRAWPGTNVRHEFNTDQESPNFSIGS